jgi:hypothetical protein
MVKSAENPIGSKESSKQEFAAESLFASKADFIGVNIFIVVWCIVALVHMAPPGPLWYKEKAALDPIIDAIWLRQYWGMFAPNFRDFNTHPQFFIDYADGTIGMREPLRLEKMDNKFEQWHRGKTREYLIDNLLTTEHSFAFPYIARFVARATNMPDNPPLRVTMGANWAKIVNEPFQRIKDTPQDCFHYSMFIRSVAPEDLK